MTFAESKVTCAHIKSEVLHDTRPFRIFGHERAVDGIISISFFGNGDNLDAIFESKRRKEIMKPLESLENQIILDIGANVGARKHDSTQKLAIHIIIIQIPFSLPQQTILSTPLSPYLQIIKSWNVALFNLNLNLMGNAVSF
jgi:hypothetical protein